MRKIIPAIALATFIAAQAFGQTQNSSDTLEKYETEIDVIVDSDDIEIDPADVEIEIPQVIEDDSDWLEESSEKTDEEIEEYINDAFDIDAFDYDNDDYIYEEYSSNRSRADKFNGHIGGFGIGINGFLTDFWSTELDPGNEFFDINTSKWTAFNFTLPGVDIGITRHLGIVSSLGLSLNNYHFDNGNSIEKNTHGVIVPSYPIGVSTYKKSKLHTGFLTIPVLLELQIPVNGSGSKSKMVYISGGITGAIKLWSKTRTVFKHEGEKYIGNRHNDFNLNVFRYGPTARVGYNDFQIYATTYFTPLFEKGKGPELYPFELGLAIWFD